MGKYYVMKPVEVGQSEFIQKYSNEYFETNSRKIEDEIENIIQRDKLTHIDVVRILAWKIGKLKHKKESGDDIEKFEYYKGWEIPDI